MADIPVLLALSDLVARWTYTRAGVQRLIKADPAFPMPVAAVNRGRTRIWDLAVKSMRLRGRGFSTPRPRFSICAAIIFAG